ncbi:DNA topoisomerase, partial [Anaerovibrio lipolyticus]
MQLFIAEKPSLAKAIASNIGTGKLCEGYISIHDGKVIVSWCYGHILSLCQPEDYDEKFKKWNMSDLPIIPSEWKLKITESCKKQFFVLKKLINSADEIVNAGDPDREGQLLVDEVISFVGCSKPVKRILLNALDDTSVKYALQHIRDNKEFISLRNSALARSRADWLVGMNLTRAYSQKMSDLSMGVFSFGRVQTPTMSLVVRREREIKQFKPVDHFLLKVV